MKFIPYETPKTLYDCYCRFWCNSCGDLFNPRNPDADCSEEDLPPALREANEIWSDGYDTYCYLAETCKGYGMCLSYEYGNCDDERLRHDVCVEIAKKDAKLFEQAFKSFGAEVFVIEWEPSKCDTQVEVDVIFPLPMTQKQMEGFSHACSILAYTNYQKWVNRRAELDAKQKRIKVKCADKAYMVTLSVTRAILVPATGINEDEARKKAVQAMYDGDYQAVSGPIVEVIDCDASRI